MALEWKTHLSGIGQSLERHRRLLKLLGLLGLLIAIAIPVFRATLGWDLFAPLRRTSALIRASVTFPLLARHDPELGHALAVPDASRIVARSWEKGRYKAVMFVGSISPCALKSMSYLQIVQRAHKNLQVVLVFAAPISAVHQASRHFEKEQFVWVSDSDREYANKLNAFFYPRLYLMDSQGRLVYIQPYRLGSQQAWVEVLKHLPEEVR